MKPFVELQHLSRDKDQLFLGPGWLIGAPGLKMNLVVLQDQVPACFDTMKA